MTARRRWTYRILSPFVATFFACLATVELAPASFFGNVLSDAAYRFPKWWRFVFWRAWYPTCGYYCWQTATGGQNGARWMWRRPKLTRWTPADDWWVFRG